MSRVVTSMSSQNIHHSEERVPLRSDSDQSCSASSPEFNFCLRQNSKQRFSHADELFSNWKNLSHPATDKKTEITSQRSNLKTLPGSSETRDSSDSDDPSFGCGFWLVRSKSVGYSMRNKKTSSSSSSSSSSEYQRSNSDPQQKKKKKMKSLQKMNSTEFRPPRLMNRSALNVPLADIFCLGSSSHDRRK